MTREEALTIIENTNSNYQQKQQVLRGLTILAKYDDNLQTAFEHDQMWAADFDSTIALMSNEEVTEMALCGWYEDQDSWAHR